MRKGIVLYLVLFVISFSYLGCSKSEDEVCDSKPSFSTLQVDDVSYTSFLATGLITPSSCDDNIISQGIVYSNSSLPTVKDDALNTSSANYGFSVENLTQGIKYYVRPFLVNNAGEFYGQQREVTTLTPGISFTEPTVQNSFQTVSLSSNYEFTENVDFEITSKGFQVEGVNIESTSDGNLIAVTVDGLELNSSIGYRPYVNTEFGIFYGDQNTFNTDDPTSTITTFAISNISFDSASVNVAYTNNYEGEDITSEVGVLVSLTSDFATETKYLGDLVNQSFTLDITNLDPNTVYYARAYVKNEFGLYLSETKEINTLNPGYDFNTLSFSGIGYDLASLSSSYNQFQGDELSVLEKGFYISESESTLTSFKYISTSTGNTISREVSPLSDGTQYFFQAFIENQYGVFTSDISNFTTNSAEPVISASTSPGLDISDISITFQFKESTNNTAIVLEYSSTDGNETGTIDLDLNQPQQDVTISTLSPNTEYNYSITLTNQYGTYVTDLTSFRTLDDTPQIELSVTQTGDNQVTIDTQVIPSPNDTNITRVYLEYFNIESGITTIELDPSLLTYNLVLDDLIQGPSYTYRIVVDNTYNTFKDSVFYTLPVTYAVGDQMFGGTIVYIDASGYHGIIMADFANSALRQWSTDYYYFQSWREQDLNGPENSVMVLNHYAGLSESAPAFDYCDQIVIQGYDDWYVPAYLEAVYARQVLEIPFEIWTSTEFSYVGDRAYKLIGFNTITEEDKNTLVHVLPFRRF